MVKMPRFETYCLETGVKTLVTETGQQLPPSYDVGHPFPTAAVYPLYLPLFANDQSSQNEHFPPLLL